MTSPPGLGHAHRAPLVVVPIDFGRDRLMLEIGRRSSLITSEARAVQAVVAGNLVTVPL